MEFWNNRWGRFLKPKSLRPKLLLIVALALGPLALASIGQGLLRFQTRHEEQDSRLLQMAMYATGNERGILSSTDLYLRELAQRPDIRNASPDCAQTLSNTLIGRPLYLDVMLVGANGKILCGASSALLRNDYAHFSWWPDLRTAKNLLIEKSYRGKYGQNVLPVTLPIRDSAGVFTSAISASIDMAWLNRRLELSRLSPDALMMIVDRSGTVMASNRAPPDDVAGKVAARGWSHPHDIFPVKIDGRTWEWAAQPAANGSLIVTFGVPEPGLFDMTRVQFLADILLPLLMIALASVAIWLGTEWLVIRWTTYLQRVSAAYTQNHFALELGELEEAPEEFRQLGYELKNMAVSIRDRDRKLNRAVIQETAMAREIHHRVKNNLQIVSSLISLYSRRISDPQARAAFKQIGVRVNALALVHRLMEKNDATPIVEMKTLFLEMADQMRASAAESARPYRLTLDVEERSLATAAATPVALFAAEALSFDMFGKEPNFAPRIVSLTFGADGPSHLLLAIDDNSFSAEGLRSGVPSPQRFLCSFADQLQGQYSLEEGQNGGCTVALRIPIQTATRILQDDEESDDESPAIFHFRAPGEIGTQTAKAE
ncbi:MAG TPA: sensor histidine kinase [Rhizomicrobium sp.]